MPELPEVEVVRAGLERHVVGATIDAVEVLHPPRSVRRDARGSTGFVAALVGQRIEAVRRRGKYFWLALGRRRRAARPPRHERPDAAPRAGRTRRAPPAGALHPTAPLIEEGAQAPVTRTLEMRFVDQRMFGGLVVSQGGADLPTEIVHIARDPIDPEFDDAEFVRRARRRTSAVKRLLLDQGLISGVGNIYADEALWRAKLHGERPGDRLTGPVLRELLGHVRAVMGEALAQGGTSFDALYVNVDGDVGLLRPLARRLRAGGRALPALRHPDPAGGVHEPLVLLLPDLPAPAAQGALRGRGVDRPPPRWDSWRRPDSLPAALPVERLSMAKALMGHVHDDVRTTAVLAVENRRLRRRVADLESLVLRLQADNDRLLAAARDAELNAEDLQLA